LEIIPFRQRHRSNRATYLAKLMLAEEACVLPEVSADFDIEEARCRNF
jgi:hypothetical protein